MADQAKLPDQAQPAPQVQEPDTTKSEQPTATETAPAPEPVTEPAPTAVASATEAAAPAAPEPAAAPAETTTAPAPEPTKSEAQAEPEKKDEPSKPEYFMKTPALEQLFDKLPTILSNAGHEEMWGVPLKHDAADIPTINVLIKFLRANAGDLKAAEDQLSKALIWRKENDPIALADASKCSYDAAKFGGLGYLTTYEREGKGDLIVTWNIYGAVKKFDETFGDVAEFIKWRAALMELAVQELKLDQATSVIDYDGEDPYQMVQVHDYLNVSFFRMNPNVKAATKKTIDVFSTAYPELLREKFFVNVPAIMGWMFALMKVFVNQNTARKFHPISNGANLAKEFPAGLAEKFPKAYGGSAADLEGFARTPALKEVKKEEPKEEHKEEPKEEQKAE
ncbi:CRAL/TRIO domain protein [Aspergillus mulundensis]|uniref:Phosphatidylinositol transfer protein SFH5 n=1 Tax=Aspergillus mulundensis TaxID=1810919 RepID=A0A3D8T3V5_9EURO|nr:Phosphatidylinositol transfer protein sfh5 [Aspergillus mulundensis]RDW93141.1 Phosphatidylinositol transfer protein sfh5 [Aspergillus mulundensis]